MNSSQAHKPQLLIVLSRFPFPLEKGDKLRAFYQIKELSKTYDITLFATSDSKVSMAHQQMLETYCSRIVIAYIPKWRRTLSFALALFSELPFQVHYFYSNLARKKIKSLVEENEYKHIYCQLIRTTEYIKNIHHIPKTLDYMDALSTGIERRIERRHWYDKWLFRLEAKRLKKYELKIFDFFENHTIISRQDRQLISHPEREKIHCIPNGIAPSFFETLERPEEYDFVFVGNMSYPPNIDAVKYMVEAILPKFPASKLLVSGATPHPSLVKIAQHNSQLEITGWVEDIRDAYLNGKIFLAPMKIGTGMQNKLLEAMALKTPCITTDLANNPIEATDGKEILVGNTSEEIISQMKYLLESSETRTQIAAAAQDFVKEKYSWEETTYQLIEIMNQNHVESTIK